MAQFSRFSAAGACLAALALAASPAAAIDLPRLAGPAGEAPRATYEGDYAENHRHRGYRGYRGYRDRIDAGDVLAGVLILGTVAAIASAAGRSRDRDYDRRAPYPDELPRYRRSYDGDGRGLDRAVSMCVDEIERGPEQVGAVDGANRTGEGWTVTGALDDGAGFTCRIDNLGRIRAVDIGEPAGAFSQPVDGQHPEDVYARAREARDHGDPGVAPGGEYDDRPLWTGDGPA